MFIPDPRWEEPNLLIPGKKPTGPVVIDWSNSLTQGLCFAAMPEKDYAIYPTIRGVASGSDLTRRAGGIAGEHSQWDNSPGAVSQVLYGENVLPNAASGPWSIFAVILPYGAPVDAATIFCNRDGTSTSESTQFRWNSSGQLQVVKPGAYVSTTSTVTLDYNEINYIGVSFETGTISDYYKNGVQDSVAPGAAVSNGGSVTSLGANYNNSAYNFRGEFYYICVWDRLLSEAEHRALSSNPYQILCPA